MIWKGNSPARWKPLFHEKCAEPLRKPIILVWFLTTDSGPKSHQYSTTFFTKSEQENATFGQQWRPLAPLPSGQRRNGEFDTAPPPDHTHAHTAAPPPDATPLNHGPHTFDYSPYQKTHRLALAASRSGRLASPPHSNK